MHRGIHDFYYVGEQVYVTHSKLFMNHIFTDSTDYIKNIQKSPQNVCPVCGGIPTYAILSNEKTGNGVWLCLLIHKYKGMMANWERLPREVKEELLNQVGENIPQALEKEGWNKLTLPVKIKLYKLISKRDWTKEGAFGVNKIENARPALYKKSLNIANDCGAKYDKTLEQWFCTREKGHTGMHEAHTYEGSKAVAKWF